MKIKTSELIGPALDWAVAKCIHEHVTATQYMVLCTYNGWEDFPIPAYSTDWAQGGPIIEREIDNYEKRVGYFYCNRWVRPRTLEHNSTVWATGPTPLIAAMRCYVASKLGDEIDIPEELKP